MRQLRILLILMSLIVLVQKTHEQTSDHGSFAWDYTRKGPDTWHHASLTCEGDQQSPIDIDSNLVTYDPRLVPLSLNGYTTNTTIYAWNFTHDSHTIIIYPPTSARLSVSGANLPGVFDLVSVHFRWGYNTHQGSEHTINGRKFPLEVQFVHRAQQSESTVIVSLLFNGQKADNPALEPLLTVLDQINDESISSQQIIDLSFLFPSDPSIYFYRYMGSLTTPPCTEGVTWIVLAKTIPISSKQMHVFFNNSSPMNFRPIQKLNRRPILANFPQPLENNHGQEQVHSQSSRSFLQVPFFVILVVSWIDSELC